MGYQDLTSSVLAQLCADKDAEAWDEFVRRHQRSVALVVLRILRHAGDVVATIVDDLVQDTYVALCANDYRLLRRFVEQGPDSMEAMIRVVAANITHDHVRAVASKKRGGAYQQVDPEALPVDALSSTAGQARIERGIQLMEIDKMLRNLSPSKTAGRDRTIFWLHFRLGMSARAIAEIPEFGLNPKGVESSLSRTLLLVRRILGVDFDR